MGVAQGVQRGARSEWGKELKQAALTAALCMLVFAANTGLSGVTSGFQWRLQEPQRVAANGKAGGEVERLRSRYLDAVRDSILGVHLETPEVTISLTEELKQLPFNASRRALGKDWPAYGASMIGRQRMDNLRKLLEDVLARGVPGSFVECGVWRGGASIFAKALLDAHGAERDVHLVDSFQGLPLNTTAEDHQNWSKSDFLRVPEPAVRSAFKRFGLLDDHVHFHKGFFRHILPAWRGADKSPIAVLRMDGDMYESTVDELYNLWDAISPGGYVIIDDWNIPPCRKAVTEFFSRNNLNYTITEIDKNGAWFQKLDAGPVDHEWYQRFNNSRTNDDQKSRQR